MFEHTPLTGQEFTRLALNVLKRELGAVALERFLRLKRSGEGDYRRDRNDWQKELMLDEALESILENRRRSQ